MPDRLVIRTLPGFEDFEARTRLYFNPNFPTSPEFDRAIAALSRSTFGVTMEDVWEEYDRFEEIDDEDDLPQAMQNFVAAADHLQNSDEDAVEMLLHLGIDLRDERGWPLLCARFFKWQALAAVAGLKGALPDPEATNLSRMASNLEADAQRFVKERRRR